MLSDALQQVYRRTWWALVLRGLIALALGVFIIARPLESVAAFALVIAIWALIGGLTQIVHAFQLRTVSSHWWLLLLGGVVSAVFGVAALYHYPGLSLTFAVVWVAYWLLLTGFAGIYLGVMERRIGIPWVWTVVFGALSALAGVYAIARPPVTLAAVMGLMAGFAIVSGVVLLIGAYKLASATAVIAAATGRAAV
jgi:uncharacterized membrane protein HdeD (DUF308 family)